MPPSSLKPREVPTKLWRKAVWPPVAIGALLILLGWGVYIGGRFFHYDPVSADHTIRDDSSGALNLEMYLWMAIIFTLLGTVGPWLIARSQLYTVRYGPLVEGRITGLATLAFKGARKVVVEYQVDRVVHKYESSEGAVAVALKLGVGDPVTVYVHPTRPKRAVVVWERPGAGQN
jgi:hypothetical protein